MTLRRSAAIVALVVAAVGAPAPLPAQAPDSTIVTAALGAAMQTNIEVFLKDSGEATVGGVALLDIDGDRLPEAFVWITPSFRQTPTVLVYRFTKRGEVHLLRENLVPGRLEPLSGRLRDAHTLRVAMDMTGFEGRDEAKFRELLTNPEDMSFVHYRTFVHADFRAGFLGYTDLTTLRVPGKFNGCAGFEFSRVEALASGRLAGDSTHRYLVALTQDDVTIYSFDGIRDDETLEKHEWMRERPPGIVGLRTGVGGEVELLHADGSGAAVAKP